MKHEMNSQNTKQMLVDVLITLLEKKPFSKITVSEIVNLCNINRKTFYYHFADVYDLFEWHLNHEIHNAVSLFDPLNDLDATITYSVNYMNQHAYLRNSIQDPILRDKIVHSLNKHIYPKALEMIQELEHTHGKSMDTDFRDFLIKSLTHITVLSILDAIENPNNYDIEKIKQYLSTIFTTSVSGFFEQI